MNEEDEAVTENYFLPLRQSLLYFSGAGKFCPVHGMRQLTRDTKSDVSCLQTYKVAERTPPNIVRYWPLYNVNCKYSYKKLQFFRKKVSFLDGRTAPRTAAKDTSR